MRLDDPHDDEGFKDLALAREFQPGTRVDWHRLTGANEAAPEGDIGGDAIHLFTGLQLDELGIGGKRIADGVASVANTIEARGRRAFWHGNDLRHEWISSTK